MNGRNAIPIADWQKELSAKRYALCDEYYSLKEEITSIEAVRRSIERLIRDDL